MLDRIKQIFSKENPNRNVYLVALAILAVTAFNAYSHFFAKKEKVRVEGTAKTIGQQDISSEILKLKVQEEKKKELQKAGVQLENTTFEPPERRTHRKNRTMDEESFYQSDEVEKLRREIEELKRKQKERERFQASVALARAALSEIGAPISYGSERIVEVAQEKPKEEKPETGKKTEWIFQTEGTILDTVKLPEGASAYVRVKTPEGVLLAKAKADILGIRFSQQALLDAVPVNVQITGTDGSPYVFSYVVDTTAKKVKKLAFLSFIKGVAEGIANIAGKTLLVPNGGGFTQIGVVENTGRYAAAKGIESGVNVLTEEEKRKIRAMVDYYVLLPGEKVKVLIIRGIK